MSATILVLLYQKGTTSGFPMRYLQHFHLDYYLTEALRSCDSVEQLQHFFQAPVGSVIHGGWTSNQLGCKSQPSCKGTLSWGAAIEEHRIVIYVEKSIFHDFSNEIHVLDQMLDTLSLFYRVISSLLLARMLNGSTVHVPFIEPMLSLQML